MKGFDFKQIVEKPASKRALIGGCLLLAFVLLGFLVLFMVSEFSTFLVDGASWYLLLFLALVWLVQWAVHVVVFSIKSDEEGNIGLGVTGWLVSFAPAIVLAVLIALLYGVLSGNVSFFSVEAGNFFLSLFILVFVICICVIIVLVCIKFISMRSAKEVVMKLVGKNDPEAAAALGSLAYSGVGDADIIISGSPEEGGLRPKVQDEVFPDLLTIDAQYAEKPYARAQSADLTLNQIVAGFGRYLESKNMYYSPEALRSFVSGLACSHLIILEGISGTGKTSLPRYFSEFIGANVSFSSVQSSWRDRSDVLGYFNDFTGTFKETPFLRALYRANYETDELNLMVLDEMNLSRVEYYFADFLSVLELDEELWQISLVPVSTGGNLPVKLEEGSIPVPQNVWFIGTVNNDESTFAITDKVYDRAIVIDFSQRLEESAFKGTVEPVHIGAERLNELFRAAEEDKSNALSAQDAARFEKLTDFAYNVFDINFGNRILNQITQFVPVYVACGGTPGKALDLMFSRKVLRKLEGSFDDNLKENLTRLEKLITDNFTRSDFSATLEAIAKLKRKLF